MAEGENEPSSEAMAPEEQRYIPPSWPPWPTPRPQGGPVAGIQTKALAAAPPAKPRPPSLLRRNFLKAVFTIGAILSIVPFVPWGSFLSSSVTVGSTKRTLLQKVVVDNVSKYGSAAGKTVNVNDLSTFPPNDHWVITYPSSGDPTLDAQNPDTFQKYELIRLPESLGGGSKKATDFVAFSKVCVHLWCSPNYNPTQTTNPSEFGYQAPGPGASTHQQYECPCHGSIYEVPDGKAIHGPASLQPAPTNAIPMLTLQADSAGNLYAYYPNYDPSTGQPVADGIEANGELGYGRDFNSYGSFIKPKGEMAADTAALTTEVG